MPYLAFRLKNPEITQPFIKVNIVFEEYPLKAGQIRRDKKERSSFLSRFAVVAHFKKS
jgi:hypothetical protein